MKTDDLRKDINASETDADVAGVLPAEPEAQEFLQEKSDWSEDISQYRKDKNQGDL